MKTKTILAALACAALMASAVPGHAATTETHNYAAFGRAILNVTQADTGVGGWTFQPATDPISVKVTDQNGPGVAVLICQEAGAAETVTGSCQDAEATPPGDDIVQKACSGANPIQLKAAFTTTVNLGVFVYVTDASLRTPACAGTGSTGTITLTRA